MSGRRSGLDDGALETVLAAVGSRLAYPPPGDLAASVGARLRQESPGPARVLPFRRIARPVGVPWFARPGWTAAAAVVVFVAVVTGAVLVFSPAARRAVADWLGLRGVRIEVTPDTPPSGLPPLDVLRLGEPVTLEEAEDRVMFPVAIPEGMEPDAVYLGSQVEGGTVWIVYRARPGLPAAHETGVGALLAQFRGALDSQALHKQVQNTGVPVTAVQVNGSVGFWVDEGHVVYFVDRDGDVVVDTLRLADNVLLWEEGGVTFRLESALPMERAVAIAESVG